MLRAIITGAPGSGKGTISKMLVERFQLNHISSGDLLRRHLSPDSPNLSSGQLVTDSLVESLVLPELKLCSHHRGWLLDGFPRTLQQAESVLRREKVDMFINLQVPDATIIERLGGRWVHLASGRTYHTSFNPPLRPGLDDVTGEPLQQRPDDRPEVVLERLTLYHTHIKTILQHFKDLNLLRSYHGTESNKIWPHIEKDVELYLTNNGES